MKAMPWRMISQLPVNRKDLGHTPATTRNTHERNLRLQTGPESVPYLEEKLGDTTLRMAAHPWINA